MKPAKRRKAVVQVVLTRHDAETLYALCMHNITIPKAVSDMDDPSKRNDVYQAVKLALDTIGSALRTADVRDTLWAQGRWHLEHCAALPEAPDPSNVRGGRWIEEDEDA